MPKRFSTKYLTVVEPPTRTRSGVGIFEFTDDYSVFHFGKMPDQIPGKGEALCRMAVFNFELLHKHGVRTHFLRYLPPNKIEFKLVQVLNPEHSAIPPDERNYLIPLQNVFRNSLPAGNSLRRRVEAGTASLADLGLDRLPEPGERLDPPLLEFTTKLEEIDRFVSSADAQRMAALDDGRFAELSGVVRRIDEVITEHAESIGLEHADGKVECAVDEDGAVMMVDNAGTPDENRFLYQGVHVGKQIMRDWYLGRGLEAEVQGWVAAGIPRSQWPVPPPLPPGFIEPISTMYRSLCEAWTGERFWGSPPLAEAMDTVRLLNSGAVSW